jgi:acetolactate synthase-1/2/3 large subunit
MINAAERPVLYLGGGVVHPAPRRGAAVRLAEQAGLPTTMTLMALGAMPVDHPLSLGMLGMHGARYTNLALEECDLLIASAPASTTARPARSPPSARTRRSSTSTSTRSELHKIKTAHVGITADVGEALEALLPRVRRKCAALAGAPQQLKTRFPMQLPGQDDPRSHYGLIRTVAACLDDEAIIATDVGQHQMWVAQAYPLPPPAPVADLRRAGHDGLRRARRHRRRAGRTGAHRGLLHRRRQLKMNIQELATAAEENAQRQDRADEQRRARPGAPAADAVLRQAPVRLEVQGRARFRQDRRGLRHAAVDLDPRRPIPRAALMEALHRPGPCLIHASDRRREQKVYPMVPPGAANTEMIGG